MKQQVLYNGKSKRFEIYKTCDLDKLRQFKIDGDDQILGEDDENEEEGEDADDKEEIKGAK